MKKSQLKTLLDQYFDKYNEIGFIESDPISIPHSFTLQADIEISGFFAATLAWGQRKSIMKSCQNLMALMDHSPYAFIKGYGKNDYQRVKHFVHRTFQSDDLLFFISFLRQHFQKNDSLESAFYSAEFRKELHVGKMLDRFREQAFSISHLKRSEKHISSFKGGSACKRLNLYLRWMVRSDERKVDFGLWKNIRPSQLLMPLDVHVHRAAIELKLIDRKQTDRLTVELLTEKMRALDPIDPVKYDFALFGISLESGKETKFPIQKLA